MTSNASKNPSTIALRPQAVVGTNQVTLTAGNTAANALWYVEIPLYVNTWHRACAMRKGIKTYQSLVGQRVSCHGCGRTIARRKGGVK